MDHWGERKKKLLVEGKGIIHALFLQEWNLTYNEPLRREGKGILHVLFLGSKTHS